MTDADALEPGERKSNTSAELIRSVREFHGLEQEAMAHLFQVSRRTVIRWEQSGHFFDPDAEGPWSDFRSRYWRQLLEKYEQARDLRCNSDGVLKFIDAAPAGAARGVTSTGKRGGKSHATAKKNSLVHRHGPSGHRRDPDPTAVRAASPQRQR